MSAHRRTKHRHSGTLKTVALSLVALIMGCSAGATDVTTLDDQTVRYLLPAYARDTSFVGDTVISLVPLFFSSTCPVGESEYLTLAMKILEGTASVPACGGLANFDLTWSSSNPTAVSKVGGAVHHVTTALELTRSASAALGAARLTFTSPLQLVGGAQPYAHDIVVLATPDLLEVPEIVSIGVGESALLAATVRNGTGPRVTTGGLVWGPSTPVASLSRVDSSSIVQSDGRIASPTTSPVSIKGVSPGQVSLTVQYKKSRSTYDVASLLSAPAMFEKKILVLVGGSLKIISAGGTQLDPARSLANLSVDSTRQYSVLDQNDVAVPGSSISWQSLNPTIASIDANGLGKCLSAGDASIKATRNGTSLSATTILKCAASAPQPTLTVSTTSLSIPAGSSSPVIATVLNAAGASSVLWVSNDPTVVTVSPASVPASASGASTTFAGVKAGGPISVTASYTANGVTRTATVVVTVTAVNNNSVTAMFLDPIAAEYTGPTAGNLYRARLFNDQGTEIAASTDGGVISYQSSDTTAIKIDPSSGLATARATTTTKTTTLVATYTKGGQTVVTATSAVTVNPAGTAANSGAVQFAVAGDAKRITVGQTIQFEVVIRDRNGIKQLPGGTTPAPTLTVSDGSALEITTVASTGGFFFNMKAKALPATSALPGIANGVTIKGATTGASATLPMVILP